MFISFFGMSGVGKTTLMENLCKIGEYKNPVFTVTRPMRVDDDISKFEYLNVEEYIHCRNNDEFILDMDDGKRYYGYRRSLLHSSVDLLIYGSPYFLESIARIGGVRILIDGDADYGIKLRSSDPASIKERQKINADLGKRYFTQNSFRKNIHIIFNNDFSDPRVLAEKLHQEISEFPKYLV